MNKVKHSSVRMIPIEHIRVVNPRDRNKTKFDQIVTNISHLGLKKPITVAERNGKDGQPHYDLVCGQGRLEAFQALGQRRVPCMVVEATREDLLLMSLIENLARRQHTSFEMVKEIGALHDRGYSCKEISKKIDVHHTYVSGLLRLLKKGAKSLLRAVERSQIPLSLAVTIAYSDDESVKQAVQNAYEEKKLRGKALTRARRLIQQYQQAAAGSGKTRGPSKVTSRDLVRAYEKEMDKQKRVVQKASICEERLIIVVTALKKIFRDENFLTLLRAEKFDSMPQYLAQKIKE
jgi:ParB family transcriptional regulator, chromosome partitioning protein